MAPITILFTVLPPTAKGQAEGIKGTRHTVGKIVGGKPIGKVIWKEEFLAQYPTMASFDCYRKAKASTSAGGRPTYYLHFERRDVLGPNSGILAARNFVVGPTWVLNHLLKKNPLDALK